MKLLLSNFRIFLLFYSIFPWKSMGSGALRRLLEIMLQSSAASFLVMRRQARKDQKRKLSAYLPDQNLHLYPSKKRWGFFIISAFQQLCFRLIQYVGGTKSAYVCLFICFIFHLIPRRIQNTGNKLSATMAKIGDYEKQ